MMAAGIGAGVRKYLSRSPCRRALRRRGPVPRSRVRIRGDHSGGHFLRGGLLSVLPGSSGWGSPVPVSAVHVSKSSRAGAIRRAGPGAGRNRRLLHQILLRHHPSVPFHHRRSEPSETGQSAGCAPESSAGFCPETLAFGYGYAQQALFNELSIMFLLTLAVGKILTTSFSIGSGGKRLAVFGPSVVIGARHGRKWWEKRSTRSMPGVVNEPGAFVVVGNGGFFHRSFQHPPSPPLFSSAEIDQLISFVASQSPGVFRGVPRVPEMDHLRTTGQKQDRVACPCGGFFRGHSPDHQGQGPDGTCQESGHDTPKACPSRNSKRYFPNPSSIISCHGRGKQVGRHFFQHGHPGGCCSPKESDIWFESRTSAPMTSSSRRRKRT